MPASNIDLQKLENLLRSATNERQRKMYQGLLDKARKSGAAEATTLKGDLENQSQPSSSIQNSLVAESPLQRTNDKSGSQSRTKTKQTKTKKLQPVEAVVNEPAFSQSKKKSSKKKESTKRTSSPEVTSGKDEKNSTVPQAESTPQPKSQEQSVGADTPTKNPQVTSSTDKTKFFQAVGLFRGTPLLKDDKLCVHFGDCAPRTGQANRFYDLTKTDRYWHKDYNL